MGNGKWEMGQVTREMGNGKWEMGHGNGKGQKGKSKSRRESNNRLTKTYRTSIKHVAKVHRRYEDPLKFQRTTIGDRPKIIH